MILLIAADITPCFRRHFILPLIFIDAAAEAIAADADYAALSIVSPRHAFHFHYAATTRRAAPRYAIVSLFSTLFAGR